MNILNKLRTYFSRTAQQRQSIPCQPKRTNKIVYADSTCRIRRIWQWNVGCLYRDFHTDQLTGSYNGKRIGTVDPEGIPVTPAVDPDERNEVLRSHILRQGKYQDVGTYSDGLCSVSTLKLGWKRLAYHSDNEAISGIWGFVNESGEEVISPQYIYANSFEDGIAIVAKGRWTLDPKWDNEYRQGCYWTEEERWGGIDKDGNEVIPFIFDEIKFFFDRNVYIAHYGGWENGAWGVIDRTGKWLAEPIFTDLDYEYHDGLFGFYEEDPWEYPDDTPMGIYDSNQKKVLFKPQFLDIHFLDDGDLLVEVFDRTLGRKIEKIIDHTGKDRFKSVYTSIYTWKDPYEVMIRDENGTRHGLIDKQGNVLLPCIYDVPWNGICHNVRRSIFQKEGKQGIMDYEGNIVVPAIYDKISCEQSPLFIVSCGSGRDCKKGVLTPDGKTVLPVRYKEIDWCSDKKHFYGYADGRSEMYLVEAI